jgi:hypothetical protein
VTKVSNSYYSAAVGHREINGIYLASFAVPGDPAQWVTDTDGKTPKHFRSADEAELAGFRVMAAKLNRARQTQSFEMKGYKRKGGIRMFRQEEKPEQHTVESVFGKKPARQ